MTAEYCILTSYLSSALKSKRGISHRPQSGDSQRESRVGGEGGQRGEKETKETLLRVMGA